MSRICVKNIGKNTSEKQLKELFSSKGEVTDVKVITSKDGKSRRFAFVGFRTELQANEAQKHFNNTFIGMSRIAVEIAKKFNDKSLLEAKQKVLSKRTKPVKEADDSEEKKDAPNKKPDDKRKASDSLLAVDTNSVAGRKKAEFLEMMKSRRNTNKWGNDDVIGATGALEADSESPMKSRRRGSESADDSATDSGSDSDSDSDDDANSVTEAPGAPEEQSAGAGKPLSDLEALRSKMTRKRADSVFSSSGSEAGSDEEGDSDGESDGNEEAARSGATKTGNKSTTVGGPETSPDSTVDQPAREGEQAEGAGEGEGEGEEIEDARLFVKNLPFSCTEEEFSALFSAFGPLSEVHLPLDEEKRGKGYGFVQFMLPEHAEAALASLAGEAFQGRVLHVERARRMKEKESSAAAAMAAARAKGLKLSSFQLKKEEERRKAMNRKEGWNAAFVRSDAVVDSLASRHGVSSADILDTAQSGGEMAVRLAIGEAQVVGENRDYFALHGVDVDVLESTHSSNKAGARSTTTLLVKNLPPSTVPEELESMFARFGSITAFLCPPSKTMVVVDFVEPSEARAAQKGLAYRSYKHTPLYLEWAPLNAVDRKKAASAANKASTAASAGAAKAATAKAATATAGDEDADQQQYSSLFIKNLNFSTSEAGLRDHLAYLGAAEGLRTVLIQKKQVGKNMLSQGYGFAEFRTPDLAARALSKLNGSLLDSHALEVKPSDKRLTTAPAAAARSLLSAGGLNGGGAGNNKLVVRNVAFQATKTEIRDLFAAFGSVKRVRIPRKMGGEHRGFAFVDFSTAQEAALAMASLRNTHLYGRHLVLEWAKEEDDQEGELAEEGYGGMLGGAKRKGGAPGQAPASALDRLRKKARQDERAIQSSKRSAGVQDLLDEGNGGVGSDDV